MQFSRAQKIYADLCDGNGVGGEVEELRQAIEEKDDLAWRLATDFGCSEEDIKERVSSDTVTELLFVNPEDEEELEKIEQLP